MRKAMRRAAIVLATAVGLGLAFGCSVDLLDLTGKACPCIEGFVCDPNTNRCVSAGAGDAGSDARGGGPVEDVVVKPDAIVDAGTVCERLSSMPTFCADFDNDDPLKGLASSAYGTGTVGTDSNNVVSAPRSLRAEVLPLGDMSDTASAAIELQLSQTATELTLDFDVLLDAMPGERRIDLLGITMPSGFAFPDNVSLRFRTDDVVEVAESTTDANGEHYAGFVLSRPIPKQVWTHVQFKASTMPKGIEVAYGEGASREVVGKGPLLIFPLETKPVKITLGFFYLVGPTTLHRIYLDNLILRSL